MTAELASGADAVRYASNASASETSGRFDSGSTDDAASASEVALIGLELRPGALALSLGALGEHIRRYRCDDEYGDAGDRDHEP